MTSKARITVAKGDGIGPEIMDATLSIMNAAGAQLDYDFIEIGEKVYLDGNTAGITPESWDTLRRNKIFFKAPITTPQGGGYKSLNVTIRKSLGLYANVRPCKSYAPYVESKHPEMDVVIIRENEEDLYAGIEHRQTTDVFQCLKLITIPGTQKIVRYAFEYARNFNRKKVTCMVKDNIMKVTDGLFANVFREIAAEYPDIEANLKIIDIGAALLADRPEDFDVVVTLNLYGDIVSDIAAQITGSVGLGGSSNMGKDFGMFEAVHGSAPDIAGKDMANPSGLISAGVMMLEHLGQLDVAEKIANAWAKTLEDGIHTGDIYREGNSKQKVGTKAFAEAIIERLGQQPEKLPVLKLDQESFKPIVIPEYERPVVKKELKGVDVFIDDLNRSADELGELLQELSKGALKLKMITNRGVKVYPDGLPETFCTDHWRCRFVNRENSKDVNQMLDVSKNDVLELLSALAAADVDVIKTENLYYFDGKISFSLGQGE
jgi:isocitrate dehydrogenase